VQIITINTNVLDNIYRNICTKIIGTRKEKGRKEEVAAKREVLAPQLVYVA